MQYLSEIFLLIQFVACVTAVIFWKNYKNTSIRIFLPFLIYSFFNELAATYFVHTNSTFQVQLLYNIYCVVSFSIYLYWFDRLLNLKFIKWLIAAIFLIGIIYDFLQINIFTQIAMTAILIQTLLVLILSFIYFVILLRSDQVINYQKKPEFWIIMGLLVFHIAFIPLSLITSEGPDFYNAYYLAINILNYILYTCYIIGFYVSSI